MDLNHGQTAADVLTRRRMLGRAGALAAAGGVATVARPSTAAATKGMDGSLQRFLDFTVTQEKFGVTAVTNAILKAPGTPSEQFVPVLRAVVTTEFTHVGGAEGDRRPAVDVEVLDPERRLRRRSRACSRASPWWR